MHSKEQTTWRIPVIDGLKALASQLIVWHHLVIYGPMADVVYPQAPGVFDWMAQKARIAVQVFLVIGGFLSARSLFPKFARAPVNLRKFAARRYVRLACPYLVAVVAAILAGALARAWLPGPAAPGEPSFRQVVAHIFLLQDIAGEEALSAGAWYVAVDFQLFAMFALLLWASRRVAIARRLRLSNVAVAFAGAAAVASLFVWNRNPGLDIWAPYFFGAYGLGVLAQRISASKHPGLKAALLGLLVAGALAVEWRDRILVAGATAVLLCFAPRIRWAWMSSGPVRYLARISYSVFVIHYPVCLAVNALVFHFWPELPLPSALGMGAAWLLSVGAGALLHHAIEDRRPSRLEQPRPAETPLRRAA